VERTLLDIDNALRGIDGSNRIISPAMSNPLSVVSRRAARGKPAPVRASFYGLSRTCSSKEDDPDCLKRVCREAIVGRHDLRGHFRLAVGTDSTSSVPLLPVRNALLLFVEEVIGSIRHEHLVADICRRRATVRRRRSAGCIQPLDERCLRQNLAAGGTPLGTY